MKVLDHGRGRHFDPQRLGPFSAIARERYDRYRGRADDPLGAEAGAVVRRLFAGGLETRRYQPAAENPEMTGQRVVSIPPSTDIGVTVVGGLKRGDAYADREPEKAGTARARSARA